MQAFCGGEASTHDGAGAGVEHDEGAILAEEDDVGGVGRDRVDPGVDVGPQALTW